MKSEIRSHNVLPKSERGGNDSLRVRSLPVGLPAPAETLSCVHYLCLPN